MEENERPERDQSQEALDKATKRRQIEERRAAYYEERKRKLEEENQKTQEAQQKADQAKQKMLSMMRQKQMMGQKARAA